MAKSLFDARLAEGLGPSKEPLWIAIDGLDDEDFSLWERAIISHVLEDEKVYHEPRALLAGPIRIGVGESLQDELACPTPISIPPWVEADGLRILSCDATCMIIVDRHREFDRLVRCAELAQLRVALMTGYGIPRAQARRFAHRVQAETHIPIYYLGDNDTWSYFAFSVLKTGSVVPGKTIPFLAVMDVRYLGVTTDDVRRHFDARRFRRRWKRGWKERINCLSKYECFQTPKWQRELHRFTDQRFAVDLNTAFSKFDGNEVWEHFLLPKLDHGRWLS